MKKIILLSLLFANVIYSQNSMLEKVEALKSGNYKDVFNSFLQLTTKNISKNEKTLEINSTLFEIKTKADPSLLLDKNLKNEYFSRNFQFNLKLDSDNNFKYKGFTGGFTYALINGRDRKLAVLSNTAYGEEFENLRAIVTNIMHDEIQNAPDGDISKINEAINNIVNSKTYDKSKNKYYSILAEKINQKLFENNSIDQKKLIKYLEYLKSLEDSEMQKIDAKPLWTVSADGSANTDGKFNKASFGTIFLVGNQKAWNEIDLRAKLTYTDTLKIEHLPRTGFNAKAGLNFKLLKDFQNKSYFEVKVYGEYTAIFNNLIADEKKNNFLANSDIRVRLSEDLWIPITIKYDTNTANFLGFLNITYNFGG